MPIDVDRHVEHWRHGAADALEGARLLINGGRPEFGLFLAPLAIEKTLKALIVRHTHDLAPKLHDLTRLSDRSGVAVPAERAAILARFTLYNL